MGAHDAGAAKRQAELAHTTRSKRSGDQELDMREPSKFFLPCFLIKSPRLKSAQQPLSSIMGHHFSRPELEGRLTLGTLRLESDFTKSGLAVG